MKTDQESPRAAPRPADPARAWKAWLVAGFAAVYAATLYLVAAPGPAAGEEKRASPSGDPSTRAPTPADAASTRQGRTLTVKARSPAPTKVVRSPTRLRTRSS